MKKLIYNTIILFIIFTMLQGCSTNRSIEITKEMAYEGVNNYCHEEYDWSISNDNPDIMYVELGEETEKEYQVIFRSYTGAFVYFYVDKESGKTRVLEYAPIVDASSESKEIDLFDYLDIK